ncbi:rRNA maturation RNase YbeY [Zeaxanthinibacter enoshimensis]|uniref:Endoribonuclease YbeY n=1 Tax=Zeaxanthinibacter enoshimensis TaxID=392009 RepID=A0A4R6TR75_9FLAO|nr:rRNA maturation RNase YbeY [Zeaxanthinibacter enoshimensis]TDQ32807.1 rRNA maturation RNase YbeY [Zeaxanthinibacter enoshimensis]
MIEYHYQTDFELENEEKYTEWLEKVVASEEYELDSLNYIFCSDEELLGINKQHLGHDYYTDIITFEYGEENVIFSDIFISIDRIKDNAVDLNLEVDEELRRVMCHGLLHMMGYSDKTEKEKVTMRGKENEKMEMFHVEQ